MGGTGAWARRLGTASNATSNVCFMRGSIYMMEAMRTQIFLTTLFAGTVLFAQQPAPPGQPNPRQQSGAQVTMFAPEQHDLYDGDFIMSANRIYMVGGL